jgi:hypothetical protein
MRWLTISHPRTGGTARFGESALPFHLRAGWRVADEPAPAPPPTVDDAPERDASGAPDPAATPVTPTRRRAAATTTDETGE